MAKIIKAKVEFKYRAENKRSLAAEKFSLAGLIGDYYLLEDDTVNVELQEVRVMSLVDSVSSPFGICCKWFGNELNTKTVKDLVKKITEENYVEVRTNKSTVNKPELKMILTNWISENSGISKEKLKHASFSE